MITLMCSYGGRTMKMNRNVSHQIRNAVNIHRPKQMSVVHLNAIDGYGYHRTEQ